METPNNPPPPITSQSSNSTSVVTQTEEPKKSFEGPEIVIQFPLEQEELEKASNKGLNTFQPRQLLRGTEEKKWSYPYPTIALSEDASMSIFTQHFGEDFCLDIFIDGLTKYCQQKWRLADGDVAKFIETFFDRRRETGPTAEKLGKRIVTLLKELKETKEQKGKESSEFKAKFEEYKKVKEQQDELMRKEMEF